MNPAITTIIESLPQKLTHLQLVASWFDIELRDGNPDAIKLAAEAVHDCAAAIEASGCALRFMAQNAMSIPTAKPASVAAPSPADAGTHSVQHRVAELTNRSARD